ncbi:GIN domain-containing protein [Duganella sp. BuS-21]|uniref:GIN domain-containing protein n=1 Tax=Duganella sp. BuS-21 TaxID=2943848 RepID=UPI0035A73C8D
MKKLLQFGLLFAAFCALFGRAAAAEDTETRSIAIDARVVRVKLDGVIDVKLRQGDVASLRLIGEKRYLDKLTASQSGDTLHLETEGRGVKVGRSGTRAELVLPKLRQVVSEGVGSTEINGFSGDELELTMDGAGTMKVVCDYRIVRANLGGVGSMNLWVSENEQVELDLRGAGYITLGGRSKMLKASLGGVGSLNAQQFNAESVNVDLSGLGNATVKANANATLNLSGLGSVIVYGKPLNRNVSVDGLGKVSWK